MKQCRKCHAEIGAKTRKCPHCGTNQWTTGHKIAGVLLIILVLLFVVIGIDTTINSSSTNKSNVASKTVQAVATPTEVPITLTQEQKAEVIAVITKNTNHFKQLWQDGQIALGKTQYADANEGLTALNDPSSNASKFSQYKQKENPANDNSMNDALQQADTYYPSNASDDKLNTWRVDMIQLSSDMGIWVNDATSWQISEIDTSKLDSDTNTVNKDFATVQKDIQAIEQ